MKSLRYIRVKGTGSTVEKLTETIRPPPPRSLEEALPEALEWLRRAEREDPGNAHAYRVAAAVLSAQALIEKEAVERLRGQEGYYAGLARRAPREGKPVLELAGGLPEELLDDTWLREKMLQVIKAARGAGMCLEARAAPIEAPVEKALISLSEMLTELLMGREDTVNAWAGAVSAPRETVRALAFWLLQPLVSAVKLAAAEGLGWAQEFWQRGVCPVCGAPASLGYMRGEGRHQFMRCRVCGTEWRFPRARCPVCGAEKPGDIVFYTPLRDKPWLRLYRCRRCGWTWKIVDEEHPEAARHGLPPRELYDVATYVLDAVAEELRGGGEK